MSSKIYYDISEVNAKEWAKSINPNNLFINYNFLSHFSKHQKELVHIYYLDGKNRFYANIFNINIRGLKGYSNYKLFKFIIKLFRFKFLYFTNSFLTNISSFEINQDFNSDKLVSSILEDKNADFIVLPDFLFEHTRNSVVDAKFHKIEVEEDMFLDIQSSWTNFESYINSLKTKYRKKIKLIFEKSSCLKIKQLTSLDLHNFKEEIQNLFNNVINENKFQGKKFNTSIFEDIILDYPNFKIFGYFLEDKLVAFSSEFANFDNHYSYFVGFDYGLNKKYAIYGRILCESINNAILGKKNKVVFGRTANEFKSNFGAMPKKSFVYLKVRNKFLAFILKNYIKNIKPKKWKQRNPFKNYKLKA